jgi:hypothetical protein
MALVDRWNEIENGLDPRWTEVAVSVTVPDEAQWSRAAALLAPAGPGRHGSALRFAVHRSGGVGPEAIRRLLARLDDEAIDGTLEAGLVVLALEASVPDAPALTSSWDAVLATLPADWSDLLCELALTSSDHLEVGALLLAPVNPLQRAGKPGFRFRVARSFGYGASPGMVRRCLERLDGAGIPGEVHVVEAMSGSHPVGTQGPVWYVAGKAV